MWRHLKKAGCLSCTKPWTACHHGKDSSSSFPWSSSSLGLSRSLSWFSFTSSQLLYECVIHSWFCCWYNRDSQLLGSSPSWAPLRCGLRQATYTCVPLSSSSIIWYQPKGWSLCLRKVTVGLVESNDSLPPGLWLMSPVGWLPRNPDHWLQLHLVVLSPATASDHPSSCFLTFAFNPWYRYYWGSRKQQQ